MMFKLFITLCATFISYFSYTQVATRPEDISPLLIGEQLPKLTLTNMQGMEDSVSFITSTPTVLVVYRGGWCPYCNKQLSGLANIEKEIKALGYQIVAISPDAPAALQQTVQKDALGYRLYSDATGQFSRAMGLSFSAPAKYYDLLSKSSGGKNRTELPVPAVYVVNANQQIEFMYVSPNYSQRMNETMLLSVLKSLQPSSKF